MCIHTLGGQNSGKEKHVTCVIPGADKFDGVATFYHTDHFRSDGIQEVKYKVDKHNILDRDNVGRFISDIRLDSVKRVWQVQ